MIEPDYKKDLFYQLGELEQTRIVFQNAVLHGFDKELIKELLKIDDESYEELEEEYKKSLGE